MSASVGLLSGFPAALANQGLHSRSDVQVLGRDLARADKVTVVIGNSVSGLSLAAKLSSAACPNHRLVFLPEEPATSRRLINGSSLRREAIIRMAKVFSHDVDDIFHRLHATDSGFFELMTRMSHEAGGLYTFQHPVPSQPFTDILGLSTSHARILEVMRGIFPAGASIDLIDGKINRDSFPYNDRLSLTMADGDAVLELPREKTVILNTNPRHRFSTHVNAPLEYVQAVQAPFRVVASSALRFEHRALQFHVEESGSNPSLMAFFAPFSDPWNTGANWYGVAMMLQASSEKSQPEVDSGYYQFIERHLNGLAANLGLSVVDPEETVFCGKAPVQTFKGSDLNQTFGASPYIVDVNSVFSPGVPVFCMDGMQAAIMGAEAFSTAYLLGGHDPATSIVKGIQSVTRDLAPLRKANAKMVELMCRIPSKRLSAMMGLMPQFFGAKPLS